jgi:hypothetical protein
MSVTACGEGLGKSWAPRVVPSEEGIHNSTFKGVFFLLICRVCVCLQDLLLALFSRFFLLGLHSLFVWNRARMDTKQPIVQDEKSTKHYEEKTDLEKIKPGLLENADYTGAEAKTDPAEIALVRKIDWRLMVCFLKRN